MGVIQPYIGDPTFSLNTFQAYYGLDFKSKGISGYDWIQKYF